MQNNVNPSSSSITEEVEFFKACQNISEISITTKKEITESTLQLLESKYLSHVKKQQKNGKNESAVGNSFQSDPGNVPKPSIVSVNTYSWTSTVKRFEAPEFARRNELIDERAVQERSDNNGGILNTVANALKYAFKSLSVVSTKMMNNETVHKKESNSQINSAPSASFTVRISSISSTFKYDDRNHSAVSPSRSTSSSSELISTYRSAKRGREEDLTMLNSKNGDEPKRDGRSPLQKRKQDWYKKIRGRDPIARMKNSSAQPVKDFLHETQSSEKCFPTVDETILPISY